MKWVWSVLGYGLFAVVLVNYVLEYGSTWEFGRYGMPRSLLAADGFHYLDGSVIDPISLSIARSGAEEETELVAWVGISAGLVYVIWLCKPRRPGGSCSASGESGSQ